MGQIDAVDTSNNTYRITFDRQGLGTHSVPDYEVLVRRINILNKYFFSRFTKQSSFLVERYG